MSTTYSNLLFHIVYSTKYRRPTITAREQKRLYEYLGGIIREQQGIVLEIGGMPDHVHILAKLSPTLAISDVLRVTKASSSKWFNETFHCRSPFSWQRGFGAFSVSTSNVESVASYIRDQEKHHAQLSFEEEFRQLLIKHEIEFHEQYLFEEEAIA